MNERFANQACITVTESALNTLTFQKLETGISIGARQAWVVHRLEYFLDSASLMNGNDDALQVGVSQSNSWSSVSPSEASIMDICWVTMIFNGAPANAHLVWNPVIKDLSGLPGGGLIIVPNPLYAFAKGTGLTGPSTNRVKLYYTQIEVKEQEFYDLWQSRVMLT